MPKFIIFSIVCLLFSSCSEITVETSDNYEFLELPDNSLVYINKNSTIKYSENFDRVVELEGEAFFNVAPGTSPFMVRTSLAEIEVTGTAFNVTAEEETLAVEVEEGNVILQTHIEAYKIEGGERAVFDNKNFERSKGHLAYRNWINDLKTEFKKLGRELKKGAKVLGTESGQIGEEVSNEGKKLKQKLKRF